ncbi:hypothetical protein SYNPS1DRAFT_26512 [Syncephalis pseudoplumigaleata]|uniref:SMP-30/Gluconolactonase/LRE-like region domain-containing protein n=1 Tax=Syncephalis pseudoplumigaleata TaxID=1712513 RepID=A0A4P9Z5E5_9FUNG|nr:hypothetical protein SYNPS1DRAFT_26512 [Syncephalis pseudoplumigaleata]|eukprot:RKP27854.1 hypothetical protein SYNPS1DRAFT_26512 [Syncephalis pseudoplumigaleata]
MQAIFLYLLAGAAALQQVTSASAMPQSNPPTSDPTTPRAVANKVPKFESITQGSSNVWFGDQIEGAAVDSEGNLYAVDMSAEGDNANRKLNTIGRVDTSGKASLFYVDPNDTTHFSGIRFVSPRTGVKGGRALLADAKNHRVVELTWTTPTTPETLTDKSVDYKQSTICSNSTMLQPNDLAVSPNGKHVYLSGMKGDMKSGSGDVWLCDGKQKTTLLDTMGRTNGIEVDPKGEYLYVTEAVGGWVPTASYIWRYKLDGKTGKPVGDKEKYFDFQAYDQSGNVDSDGMRFDTAGNLYVTRNGRGEVVKITAKQVGETIKVPFDNAANLEFAGKYGRTLHVIGKCPGATEGKTTGCVVKAAEESATGRAWSDLHPVTTLPMPAQDSQY